MPSGDPANSDSSFDLPSGDGPITLVNRAYQLYPYPDESVSGSFTIPTTVAGNLLVIFLTNEASWGGSPVYNLVSASLSDDAADVFTQVPWYSLPGSGSSAGYQTAFVGLDPDFPTEPYGAEFDAWYTVTNGGATTISWALASGGFPAIRNPEFWVYELTGLSSWAVIDCELAWGLYPQTPPCLGPSLNGIAPNNAYFCMMEVAEIGPTSAQVVYPPWTLETLRDPSSDWGRVNAYIIDSKDVQQPLFDFSSEDGLTDFTSCGVVFGPSGYGPPPPPPPPPVGGPQPNVCIIC